MEETDNIQNIGTPREIQMLKTILDQAADIHKESTLKIQGLIQQAENEINKVIQAMQLSEAGTDYTSIINSLKERINNLAPQSHMERVNNMLEEPFDKFLTVLNCVFHIEGLHTDKMSRARDC
ncbi:hypothetical protein FCM35_KLT07682 [Carex littledalei]|uniref:Uncharacterized protein n=1 Tax=Carex littledalei TaxID=544730 RepID=A0A833QQT7_9POAL|nr:hypothetical protein FCM35_KLT07682 [Carex littledalei]